MKDSVLRSTDKDLWIYQGNLLRYRPGFSDNYIAKWCTISRNSFAYYRDKYSANCFLENPLVVIPINQIKSVERVLMQLPEEKGKPKKSPTKGMIFQFEIVLHDPNPQGEPEVVKIPENSQTLKPQASQSVFNKNNNEIDPTMSLQISQEGHLMRSPYKVQGSVQNISTASVRKDKKEHQWSDREIEWYLSEKRFLFVAENGTELQKWLISFKWVLDNYSGS